jgi:hypothetical protein
MDKSLINLLKKIISTVSLYFLDTIQRLGNILSTLEAGTIIKTAAK